MRKAQKKRAEEFIRLLGQAHEEIRRELEKGEKEAARELLADCQKGAIALGNLIEETEGEGETAVSLLEEYCERVYRLHEELAKGEPADGKKGKQGGFGESVNGYKVYKKLQRLLIRVESCVKQEIRVQKEAVFLPYKASMWDSMESVWRAASEDADCDVHVVPIPYYARRPDGSFGELRDESREYPEYVPVERWDTYAFEERRPDLIFIHNPYDKTNFVTSVPPFFYSENLKRFTERLVYIPYFILDEVDPKNEVQVREMEHFCLTPGVLNADRVIVQSEAMREVYVRVLTEAFGEKTRKGWERKILGLGSPKADKVMEARREIMEATAGQEAEAEMTGVRREDTGIPEAWERIIRKPDGGRKKVVLYNTRVGALLAHNGKMLEKMKRVFAMFRERREDVALLWRPHPLIEATIKSMRPELWEAYREIVREYRESGWGIYDNSAKLERALAVSDAYFGDPSSLVQLCKSVGMPVLLQEADSLENGDGNDFE